MNNILESCLLLKIIQTYHIYSHYAQGYIRCVISESACAYDSATKIFSLCKEILIFSWQLAPGRSLRELYDSDIHSLALVLAQQLFSSCLVTRDFMFLCDLPVGHRLMVPNT